MTPYPAGFWRTNPELLQQVVNQHGSFRSAEVACGLSGTGDTFAKYWKRHGLPPATEGRPAGRPEPIVSVSAPAPDGVDPAALLDALKKAGEGASVSSLADAVDASPRRVQAALTKLREQGYRVDLGDESRIRLDRVSPSTTSVHPDLLPLLDGTTLRVGVVSDTHLSSRECALEELHTAYDYMAREGITTVLHAGDWTCGRGIFRGQDSEILNHTLDSQVEYLVENYPRREGMQTIGIAGNHDLEGLAGQVGFDPVAAMAARRSDVTYLTGMSAWLELGAETLGTAAPYVHLLHGKGGMSYAVSYKAQKLVDGYPAGRKPAILIPGHWHVRGQWEARNVQVLFPACFEKQSPFLARLGLHPAVGFHILEVTVGADGSVVGFMARYLKFYEGRVVG